jgi:hypothetical protein
MVQKLHSPHSVGGWSPSEEGLDQTIKVWQPHSERTLTREDAREITTNLVGFFRVLMEWEREDRAQRSSLKQEQRPTTGPEKSKIRPSS